MEISWEIKPFISLLLIIYSKYKDKKDLEKLGVTPLSDNHRLDGYFYQIILFTGHRKDSGTKSKVYLILSGDQDETKVITLTDSKRSILLSWLFQGNSSVPLWSENVKYSSQIRSLGPLNYVRIWHDNRGKGSSASLFVICKRWKSFILFLKNGLQLEWKRMKIERVLPVASKDQKNEFSYVLSKQAYHSLSESHLWFSIFSRPPSNKFTRVQRRTITIQMEILFWVHSLSVQNRSIPFISFYPKTSPFSLFKISIGVIVEILSFLPSILLVQAIHQIKQQAFS